jgi:hypothetical protein
MISDKFRCIFIHIPKNAGTSIESKICSEEETENLLPDHRTILDLEPLSPAKLLRLYKTDQIYSMARRAKYFGQKNKIGTFYKPTSWLRYKNYYKFTVVRNPWSRTYSWYRNVINDINHRKRYKVSHDCSFHDFVKYHLENQHALRTQFYWLHDSRGSIPMDFVGRFENLQTDFSKIAETIGLKNAELPKERYTGESASYIEAFNDQTKDIIWKRYEKEIKYFGFEFGE